MIEKKIYEKINMVQGNQGTQLLTRVNEVYEIKSDHWKKILLHTNIHIQINLGIHTWIFQGEKNLHPLHIFQSQKQYTLNKIGNEKMEVLLKLEHLFILEFYG